MIKKLLLILLCFINLSSYALVASKMPVIIDTDMGADDIMAIVYLMNSPQITIKGIVVDCDASVHCPVGGNNLLRLLTLMHYKKIPVALGSDKPLGKGQAFHARDRMANDGLLNQLLPRTARALSQLNAPQLLVKLTSQARQPITLLSIGSLTTLAQALKLDPQLPKHIQQIYMMGGAVNAPGNVDYYSENKANKKAEWNIFFDPVAARQVFKSKLPITLIPLDATNQVPLTHRFFQRVSALSSLSAKLVFALLNDNKAMLDANEWYFWDPLAAVILTHPNLCDYQFSPLKVALSPQNQIGALQKAYHSHPIRVCTHVNKKRFKTLLLSHY